MSNSINGHVALSILGVKGRAAGSGSSSPLLRAAQGDQLTARHRLASIRSTFPPRGHLFLLGACVTSPWMKLDVTLVRSSLPRSSPQWPSPPWAILGGGGYSTQSWVSTVKLIDKAVAVNLQTEGVVTFP